MQASLGSHSSPHGAYAARRSLLRQSVSEWYLGGRILEFEACSGGPVSPHFRLVSTDHGVLWTRRRANCPSCQIEQAPAVLKVLKKTFRRRRDQALANHRQPNNKHTDWQPPRDHTQVNTSANPANRHKLSGTVASCRHV